MRISSGAVSIGLHCLGVVALLLFTSGAPVSQLHPDLRRDAVPLAPLRWHRAGGGGQREPLAASKGVLPPRAQHRIFTPPTAHVSNEHPKLAVTQAILIDPDLALPDIKMDR
ncbi:MAG TPA: hypothetical protein VF730_13280 [Terracidiphilus sp.]